MAEVGATIGAHHLGARHDQLEIAVVSTADDPIGSQNDGQPLPESYFVSLENSGSSQTTHLYVPASLASQYSPVKGRSVPASWVT